MNDRRENLRQDSDAHGRPDAYRDNSVNGDAAVIRPLFTRTIDLGHILQAIVMACGAVVYIVTVSGSVADANRKVDDLKSSVNQQFTDLRAELRAGLDSVHHQIAILPDATARLAAVERRLDSVDHTAANAAARLDIVEQRSLQTEALLDSLLPATRAPLGPHRQ